jgi:hypothetical protein
MCQGTVAAGDTVTTGSSAKGLKGSEGLQRLWLAARACMGACGHALRAAREDRSDAAGSRDPLLGRI